MSSGNDVTKVKTRIQSANEVKPVHELLKVHTPGHLKQSGYDEMFRVELFRSATEVHKHTKNGKEYTKESSPNDKDISNVSSFSCIHS